MKRETRETRSTETPPRSVAMLWLVVLGPPVIWLVQFEAKYVLAAKPLAQRHPALLIGTAVVSLALVALLAFAAAGERRDHAAAPLDREAGVVGRNRFMAVLGLMSCAMFALVIIAQAIADFFFQAAQQ